VTLDSCCRSRIVSGHPKARSVPPPNKTTPCHVSAADFMDRCTAYSRSPSWAGIQDYHSFSQGALPLCYSFNDPFIAGCHYLGTIHHSLWNIDTPLLCLVGHAWLFRSSQPGYWAIPSLLFIAAQLLCLEYPAFYLYYCHTSVSSFLRKDR